MVDEATGGSSIRTLVVEDHALFRESFVTWLSGRLGLEVVGAVGSGEDALRVVDDARPDLALVDIRLPGIDGIATCEKLLERSPDLRVVMVTLFASAELQERAFAAGARGVVAKSSPGDVLEHAIHEVMRGGSVIDPEFATTRALTPREREVLAALAQGMSAIQAARVLSLSYETVKDHVKRAKAKLGVRSRNEAIAELVRRGLA